MEKIPFTPEGGEQIELYVLEQTTLGGIDYYLVADSEEGDCECMIMKDTSGKGDAEAVFEVVTDDKELNGVAGVFESLLDDVSIVADDSSDKNE